MLLSALDLSPASSGSTPADALHASLRLAEVLDDAGYTRLWFAEHHNIATFQAGAPELPIALALARTARLRVGSGGVMLPNHSPLRVAEAFLTLEALFPGRVDLGLGRAPGTDGRTALALRGGGTLGGDDFAAQIALLRAFAGEEPWPDGSPFAGVLAQPQGVGLPPLWVLGSSTFGARLAAELGVGYAFAAHFSAEDPREVLALYRRHFRPGPLDAPHAILGVNALAAPSADEARELALTSAALSLGIQAGRRGPLLPPQEAADWLSYMEVAPEKLLKRAHIGEAGAVWASLRAFADACGADELMVTTFAHDPAMRERSYRLLAGAAGLGEGG